MVRTTTLCSIPSDRSLKAGSTHGLIEPLAVLQVRVLQSCCFHDVMLSARLQVLVAMDWNDQSPWLPWLAKGVMAASCPDKDPTVLLQNATHSFA
jgi:hypothetical protein